MVQTHRSDTKATVAKDVSPMRNMENGKQQALNSTAANFSERPRAPAASTSTYNNNHADKWKYNNMVNNQREQFNSLHFC